MWKVLIADEEPPVVRSIIRHIHWEDMDLELAGTAFDGEELLAKIRSLKPDVVITDICMPGITGLEVIKESHELKHSPRFIIVSAYTTFEYARTALQLGVDEFLPKPVAAAAIQQAIQASLAKLGSTERPEPHKNCFISTASQYIEANFEKPLQLKDVARQVYFSTTYFSALFKEKMGISFIDYLTRVRLKHAKEWLEDIHYSIGEIAVMSGYSNAKYFGKVFKAETGMTPGQWRRRNNL